MKRIAMAVAMLFIFGASAPYVACAKEYKIAYIDLARIFDDYSKTKSADKALEEKGKAKESERKVIVDAVRKMKDEQALLSEKAKAEKQGAIDAKVKELQEFDRTAREELMKLRNDTVGDILKDIEKIVTDFSKEQGYDIVLNSRMLLYGKEEYDVTNEVMKRLGAPAK